MIKTISATTREIDNPKTAAAEIIAALEPSKNLLKNSMGIISCFSEFEETGVLKAICDALPFDCIGATTCVCSANGQTDQIIFSVTVLTSDDCSFETVELALGEKYDESIDAGLSPLFGRSDIKPALIFSYFPLMHTVSGDMMLSAIDKATGGIPLYGTVAVDHTMDYATAKTIRNGEMFRESIVLGMISGNFDFTFEIASLDEDKIRKQKAIITESDGNILIGVNGKTALEYLEEIGLTKTELATGLGILPLVIGNKDGTKPVARAVFALTPDGHAVCGGTMPVGATLSIGRLSRGDILQNTETIIKPFFKLDSVMFSYSCVARHLALGADNTAEAEKVCEIAGDNKYVFACSGGEICPLPDSNGILKNFFHNFTNILCRIS